MSNEYKISIEDHTANYSALLYVIAEQQLLLGRLLEELIRTGVINSSGLSKITEGRNAIESLSPIYSQLYKDYAEYFVRVKMVLAELEKEELQNGKERK